MKSYKNLEIKMYKMSLKLLKQVLYLYEERSQIKGFSKGMNSWLSSI